MDDMGNVSLAIGIIIICFVICSNLSKFKDIEKRLIILEERMKK